ncbi:MAG: NAD(P)-dependent dehydrogenase (short-subunit alcohol dehydrogenase family) [Bradymonadia bacterium]|jgi:NAD(P)-dependent dehydrogenase (short-subunit alcohol dehydrogenase family)
MSKTILITGATDGIGLATAKMLAEQGHHLLLHGRSPAKLENVERALAAVPGVGPFESYVADLSDLAQVEALAATVVARHRRLDVLINNAGVFSAPSTLTSGGLDLRFAVNTIAPYLLTKRLLPLLGSEARVVNVASAGQAAVDLEALAGSIELGDYAAYAQSKLALMMWTASMARTHRDDGRVFVSVNPGSLLRSKMVTENFDRVNGEVTVGAKILVRAALSDEFSDASGKYWDNDAGRFAPPHLAGRDPGDCDAVVKTIEAAVQAAITT